MKFSEPLHGLRGVASIMVLLAHVSFGYYDHFYRSSAGLGAVVPYVANFGTFGVELFFVISGYVISASCLKYDPLAFAGRRLMRIYPVFAAFTLLYFVLNSFAHYEPARMGIGPLLANLTILDLFFGTATMMTRLIGAILFFVQAVIAGPGFFASALTCAPARFVGTISYSLYLTHPYTYLIMRETCKRLHVSSYPWQVTLVPYLAGNLILALGVSWCVHRFIEIAPYKLIYGQRIYRDPLETVAGTAAPDATPVDAARIANGLRP
ncbi:acyltransferase family protein [Sphingomonas sp. R86520]|uniref:acyltransferase family protein n=1 Tax=Sphingomonas sp. R86520 TaxID=3093859 RepID=UPI0036D3EF09